MRNTRFTRRFPRRVFPRVLTLALLVMLFGGSIHSAAGQGVAFVSDKPYYRIGETVRIEYRLPGVESSQYINILVEARGDKRTEGLSRLHTENLNRLGKGVIELPGLLTSFAGPVRLSVEHPLLEDPPSRWIWVFSDLDPWPDALSVVGGNRVRMGAEFTVVVQRPAVEGEEPPDLIVRLVRPAFIVEGGAMSRQVSREDMRLKPTESSVATRAPRLPGTYEIRLLDGTTHAVLACLPLEVMFPSAENMAVEIPEGWKTIPTDTDLYLSDILSANIRDPFFYAMIRHAESKRVVSWGHTVWNSPLQEGMLQIPSQPGPYELIVASEIGDEPVIAKLPLNIVQSESNSQFKRYLKFLNDDSGPFEVGELITVAIASEEELGTTPRSSFTELRKEQGGKVVLRVTEPPSYKPEPLEYSDILKGMTSDDSRPVEIDEDYDNAHPDVVVNYDDADLDDTIFVFDSLQPGQTVSFRISKPGFYNLELGVKGPQGWVRPGDQIRGFECLYRERSGTIRFDKPSYRPGDRVNTTLEAGWPVLDDSYGSVSVLTPNGERIQCDVPEDAPDHRTVVLPLEGGIFQMRWYSRGSLISAAPFRVPIELEPGRLRVVGRRDVGYGEPIRVEVELDDRPLFHGDYTRARVLLYARGEMSPTGTWREPHWIDDHTVRESGVFEFEAPFPGRYEVRLYAGRASSQYILARIPLNVPGPGGEVPVPGHPNAPEPTDLPFNAREYGSAIADEIRMADVHCAEFRPLPMGAAARSPGVDPDLARGEKEREPPKAEYTPPPFLALEAAVYPRKPIPGLPLTIGFRIENSSQYPAAGVSVDLTLADPRTEHAPRSLVCQAEFCEDPGDGHYRCFLGDMNAGEVGDLLFHLEAPMSGMVIWTANLESAGDLGGASELGGLLGDRAPPRIMDVVVLADQTRVEHEVPSYPYPFGPNSRGRQSRYLLIVGHNLPQRPADNLDLPDSETVHYGFLAYPDSDSQFYQELFAEGWKHFYEADDAKDAGARAEADGYDAILVRADLLKGILPGQHTVTASGAQGHWSLEFGDISARLSFVRLIDDGSFDLLTNAYLPERIYLAVETNMHLPLEQIPVFLNAEELGAGQTGEIALMAQRSDIGDGRLYLTGPLDLHRQGRSPSLAGGVAIPVRLAEDSLGVLQARTDNDFMVQSFRIPLDPIVASVTINTTPAAGDYSWLWKDALSRAAACNDDVTVDDWNRLTQAESEEIWNLMILTTSDHFPGQSVTFGHHAAAILMRDMFVAVTEKQLRRLEWIKGNSQAVKGLLRYMKPRAHDDGFPLLRMEVKDFQGGESEYRYVVMNDSDWLAEQYGVTEEAIEAWRERETVTALGKLTEAANEALADAREAGDCEVEDLIRLTGFSFGAISRLLKAELVTLAQTSSPGMPPRLLWTPDASARFWVDQVAPLAAAVKEQQTRANVDTDITLAAVAVLTMPFMLAENATVTIVLFAVDLMDLGVTTVHELSQYFASEAELRFALGASITIGDERYDDAMKNAKGWASTAFGIGTSAFGAIAGGLDALPELAKLRRVARGRHVVSVLGRATDIPTLKPVDLQDFGAFAMSAHMRRQSSGAAALSSVEQRALALVDEYGTLNKATRMLPEPDLPPANIVDSFAPSAPMRFDPEAGTGFATARPPLQGRIETPRTSGEVPNALEARAMENGHVRFMTAEEIEELPLGERLGGGYTSEVFAHADDPENLAIRITYLREGAPAAALDEFGNRALRTRVRSEHVRPVRVEKSFDVVLSEAGQPEISRVMVVERVPETAQTTIARQGGRMTIAQMMAYEGTLRDLNRQGLVWLDNKWDNFAFVPAADGSGRVQVVVLDPGGIVPIRADAGLATGQTAADVARQIQLRVNGDFATHVPEAAWVGTPKYRTALRKDVIKDDYGDAFDYGALGISGRDQLLFNPKSGEDFDYLSPLFEAVD